MNAPRSVRSSARVDVHGLAPQRWRNGGGWTRELLTWPDPPDWRLRISLATIESPGPFSAFPGVQRLITVVDGAGVLLKINTETHRLSLDSEPLNFDGNAPAYCTPIDGPTSDLNLMTRGGSSAMLRAAPGVAWKSPLSQRGLYARMAGILHAPAGWSEPVPAGTLLWFREAHAVSFSFTPDHTDAAAPAWWLGYSD